VSHAPNTHPPDAPLAPAPTDEAQAICREWFEAHGRAVYTYFRFHVPLADVAEDLTAETFFKVVRAAGRFDAAKGSAKTWILTAARNVLADWRRRARLRHYVAIGAMHDLAYDAPRPRSASSGKRKSRGCSTRSRPGSRDHPVPEAFPLR
jgi:DNA-directed RNA polymerase specialized sigma24 family protein